MATNRAISFPELWNGTRSTDYPIGIVVLDVDKNAKGTGSFAPACKIKFNKKGELEIENYGQKPFRLANVHREKCARKSRKCLRRAANLPAFFISRRCRCERFLRPSSQS